MRIKLYSIKRSSFFIGLTIAASFFNAGLLYAQNKTVQVTQQWQANDSSWRNYERYTTTYDNNCTADYDLIEFWDTATNQWKNANQSFDYNNSFGSPDSIYDQSWNGNAWVNSAVLRYTYNNNHQLTSIITFFWSDDSLIPGNKTAWTFDNNNFLVNQLYQRWDAATSNWLNQSQYLYTNNPDGTPAVKHAEIGTADGTGWIVSPTITYYYYNSFGKDSVNITVDSSNVILNQNKQAFLYDANHYLINDLLYNSNFDTGGWDASSQNFYSPNAKGLDTLITHQIVTGSNWVNSQKTTISYASCILPVTFLNFKAQLINGNVQLKWQTGSEVNASLFHLQRSTDGKVYTTITNINAKGQSFNDYSYKDDITSINKPGIYYRLLEQDKDGKLQMSNTVMVALNKSLSTSFIISPNPATSKVFVSGGAIISIDVFDWNGRLLISGKPGADNSINISKLPKGVYMVKIQDGGNHISSTKLVVQ